MLAVSKIPTLRLVRLGKLADAMALQAAVDGAAGQLGIDATAHHLDDIVQRQLQRCSQLANQPSLRRPTGWSCSVVRPVRTVANRGAAAPAADRGLADAQFSRQLRNRLLAALDVGIEIFGVVVALACRVRSMTQGAPDVTDPPLPDSDRTILSYHTLSQGHIKILTRPYHFFTSGHAGSGGPNASSPGIFARIL